MTGDERAVVERCRLARRDDRLAVLEGFHALKHAIRFGARIEAAYAVDLDKLAHLADELAPDVASEIASLVQEVSPAVFSDLAPHAPETGVLALAERPKTDLSTALLRAKPAPVIWLEEPAHLGNVGAVIRVAAAAGAAAIVTTGRHDPWDPAAIRGSAGLHFAQPVLRLQDFPPTDRSLIAIDPEGDPITPEALPACAVLAFGSERRGLSTAILDRADQRLALPMQPNVSSLNLATAVAAVLYAWRLTVRPGTTA